jgi:hypothetical protein
VAIGIGRMGQDVVAGTDGNKFEARGNWGFSFVRRNSRVTRRILWSTFNVLLRSVTQNQVTFLNPPSQFSVVDMFQPKNLPVVFRPRRAQSRRSRLTPRLSVLLLQRQARLGACRVCPTMGGVDTIGHTW